MTRASRHDEKARWADQVGAAIDGVGPEMFVRRAMALQVELSGDGYRMSNQLIGKGIRAKAGLMETMRGWTDWRSTGDAWFQAETASARSRRRDRIVRLVEVGVLTVKDSPFAELDERHAGGWEWGPTSGAFHFAMRDAVWGSPDQILEQMSERAAIDPGPEVTRRHEHERVELTAPDLTSAPYALMAGRESERFYSGEPIGLDELARVIHSGVGVINWSDEGDFGVLPHTMTPSGGARNPYEAFVVARAVTGLEPGTYHYSATQHSLESIAPCPSHLGSLLADLDWVDYAAAVVVLVADFRRTMWKYKHPTAHRVVMIEAGHIAQNMLLSANAEGIGSIPIAAFKDETVEELLGTDPLYEAAIHAVVLGQAAV